MPGGDRPCLTRAVRSVSRVITSDDVFDDLLDFRCMNENIAASRRELLKEYTDKRYSNMQMRSLEESGRAAEGGGGPAAQRFQLCESPSDAGCAREIQRGERFLYFTRHIGERGLYLLDEPENSLSARMQLELARFLEDSVRFYGCQFVIATHSPLLLALRDARVSDLDRTPVSTCRWTDVENVRTFAAFFQEHAGEFPETP